jgi:hypothetical protein
MNDVKSWLNLGAPTNVFSSSDVCNAIVKNRECLQGQLFIDKLLEFVDTDCKSTTIILLSLNSFWYCHCISLF